MANKRNREIWAREEKQRRYKAAANGLSVYPIIAFSALVVVALLFFVNWAYVYNTDYGVEVKFSGFNALFAALKGDYDSVKYGDISMPFYYYAKKYCETLGVLTIIAFAVLVADLTVNAVAFICKSHALNLVGAALSIAETAVLVACFMVALAMKNGKILSTYCSGNPACSIQSAIIFPIILAVLSIVPSALATIKYYNAKKFLK